MRKIFILIMLITVHSFVEAKLPEIDPGKVTTKINEIMAAHASHKELTPDLVKRALNNYLEELDPSKTYFIKSDIVQWSDPSDQLVEVVLNGYKENNFDTFKQIHEKMLEAIERRHAIEEKIDLENLPKHVNAKEFKDMDWVESEDELLSRLEKIKSLQLEAASKLEGESKELSMQRMKKQQAKFEEKLQNKDPIYRQKLILSNVLKATASSLDAHTAYLTPDEATQFMISVQQRLFGIGAQLRDDIHGFTIVKVIDGGPAADGGELKAKDRIIAVDGEPVVGMDIISAVELIRGPENTPVVLTVIRSEGEGEEKNEKTLDVTVIRGEVVLKDTRYESSYEPFGDGSIGYIKLFSFYQDPEYSSATDIAKEIENLKSEHNLKGLILDLRNNTGGLLSQAVNVTGLFITKGVVVGIKDHTGNVQFLRDLDGTTVWDGPLIVLVNRASASASEIVSQTLQDYGRALVIGDDHTYGKGSFQTFTLNDSGGGVNPEGEYKVTRGRYYTVSGKTPQLNGVQSDIVIPGPLSQIDFGEKFAKYPLDNDSIPENFDDSLSDVPFLQRDKIRALYKFDLQQKMHTYNSHLDLLKRNSDYRVSNNKNYQAFLREIAKEDVTEEETEEQYGQNDLQLIESYNVMKDLLQLLGSN